MKVLVKLLVVKVCCIILTEWNKPEEGVVAEDTGQVAAEATIVGLLSMEGTVIITALLAELDGCVATGDQIEVEGHECGDYEGKD